MFLFHVKQFFKSIYIRFLFFFLILGIIFSVIFLNRITLFNSVEHFFHGQLYDDPSTYKHKRYGFAENPRKAEKLLQSGLLKLSNYSYSLYKLPKPKQLLKNADSASNNWTALLQDNSLKAIDMLFYDMSLACPAVFSADTLQNNWERDEKFKKRHLIKNSKKGNSSFVVTIENYRKIQDYLLELDQSYFELSLQKKPDLQAAVSLRTDLFTALCLPTRSPQFWQKAVDYIEYKTEKDLLSRDENLSENPDALYHLTQKELKNNNRYAFFLKNFYISAGRYSNRLDWQLQESWNSYRFTKDKYYFKNYLKTVLQKLQVASREEHCKFYEQLYQVDYRGIEKEFLYTYTLAKAAYGCEKYKEARSIINHIVKQKFYKEQSEYQLAKQLQFLLELQ